MRPFVRTMSSKICAVTPVAEGYAATTETGVELVSPDLESVATIPAGPGIHELWGQDLRELPDGRFLVCSSRSARPAGTR